MKCKKCGAEMEEIFRCGFNRGYACSNCEPELFKAHPCEGWKQLVKEGRVSYLWAVCDCSPCERSYEIKKDDEWKPVSNCPFCGVPINAYQFERITTPVFTDRPYTLYDEVQDLKRRVTELEKRGQIYGTSCEG